MVWVRIDDEILDNRKMLRAGTMGFALYVAGLVYCGRNLTDGFVPWQKVATLLDMSGVYVHYENMHGAVAARVDEAKLDLLDNPEPYGIAHELVESGLWLKEWGPPNEKDMCELIGYRVHDYLKYNPSRDEVLKGRDGTSAIRAKAGAKGGKSSGVIRRSKTEANAKQTRSKPGSKGEANTQAKRSPDPGPDPDPRPIEREIPREVGMGGKTPPPDKLVVTPEIELQCFQAGYPQPTPESLAACLLNAKKMGHWRADWSVEIIDWQRKQAGFDRRDRERLRDLNAAKADTGYIKPPDDSALRRVEGQRREASKVSPEDHAAFAAKLAEAVAKVGT